MKKTNPFSDIKSRVQKQTVSDFVESAKVDGQNTSSQKDINERRGSSYVDKDTGHRIKLSGKIIQVPVNGYELEILENGAKKMGLPLGSYLRALGIEAAKEDT